HAAGQLRPDLGEHPLPAEFGGADQDGHQHGGQQDDDPAHERACAQAGHRLGFHPAPSTFSTASATVRTRSTTRGLQRDAMLSSISNTWLFFTAVNVSQPGRLRTVSALCPQQMVSARKIRSGSASMIFSAESCGYPPCADGSFPSAMLRRSNSP